MQPKNVINLVKIMNLFELMQQNDAHTLAPASLQILQQLQATSNAATPVAANANTNALSSVQHQLLLQQHLGLGAATPAPTAPAAVPSAPEINTANLQGLATLASLSNSAGEYGQYQHKFLLFFSSPLLFSVLHFLFLFFFISTHF